MTFDDITIATYQNLFGNEANKIIQELQPRKLNDQLKKYELKLKHYEDLYQNEINMFESKLIQTSLNHQHTQVGISMTLLKYYLSHHTNQLIRQIRYREACVHVKLVRQHHRHLLSKQQIVDVYPHIIADVPTIALNRLQLDYLSKSKLPPFWWCINIRPHDWFLILSESSVTLNKINTQDNTEI
ncbi:unnamed protein product [Rotaria socialis]